MLRKDLRKGRTHYAGTGNQYRMDLFLCVHGNFLSSFVYYSSTAP